MSEAANIPRRECGHDVCLDIGQGCRVTLKVCSDCRQGHYDIGGGVVSNYPCQNEGCECWFCDLPVTPAQEYADRLHVELGRLVTESPCSYVHTEGSHFPNWCAAHDEPMAVVARWCAGLVARAARNIRYADAGGEQS